MEREGDDEAGPQQPEEHGAGEQGHEQLAEELAVVVEVLGAQVHLQVPDGVGEHEAHDHEARDRHDPLLADGRAVERHRPRAASRRPGMHRLGGWPLHRGRHRSICLHGAHRLRPGANLPGALTRSVTRPAMISGKDLAASRPARPAREGVMTRETTWEAPGPGYWEWQGSHVPGIPTPIYGDIHVRSITAGIAGMHGDPRPSSLEELRALGASVSLDPRRLPPRVRMAQRHRLRPRRPHRRGAAAGAGGQRPRPHRGVRRRGGGGLRRHRRIGVASTGARDRAGGVRPSAPRGSRGARPPRRQRPDDGRVDHRPAATGAARGGGPSGRPGPAPRRGSTRWS